MLLLNIEEVKSTHNVTKNILLVDDERDITLTIKNILEYNGLQIVSFNDSIISTNYN